MVETLILVVTRDFFKLCFIVSRFIPAESTCVSFWSPQCDLCSCCCSAQRVLCEGCPAHVFRSFVDASAHLVHETVCS